MRTAGRDSPPPLVKQIIAYLAFTRHEKAERALITYLKVFENMLLEPETAAYPPAERGGAARPHLRRARPLRHAAGLARC